MYNNISVIAFDADDTLWVNEPYFRESEDQFCTLMTPYLSQAETSKELLKIEIENISVLGFGVKSFIISMIETALKISKSKVTAVEIQKIITIGKAQLQRPVEILEGVEKVLKELKGRYKLIMATKGDLVEQEGKLAKSGLEHYFHHIEILSDKKLPNYSRLIQHLDIPAENFLMIGNSLKSDIIPILELGGSACYIPFHTTWDYEKVDVSIDNKKYEKLDSITELLKYL